MEQKAWIEVKSPRFSRLGGYAICWGDGIWCETFDTSNVSAKYAVYKNYRYQIYPQVDPNLVYSQYTCCLDDPEILTRYHRLRPESVAGIERNMQVFQSL